MLIALGAGTVAAHIHPFNPAAACAPEETGAGNEAQAFFTAPGIQKHWNMTDLLPDVPGVQFLIQLANPGKADDALGSTLFLGNPGTDAANCATPKSP